MHTAAAVLRPALDQWWESAQLIETGCAMFNWWMFFVVDVTNGVEHIANQWGYEAHYNRYKSYVIPGETLIPGGRGEAFGRGIG